MNKKCYKLYEKAKAYPKGLRFHELKTMCECIGMICDRTKGSHFIYRLDDPFYIDIHLKDERWESKALSGKAIIEFY